MGTKNCKLQIANCKLQIERRRHAYRNGYGRLLQFAICNLQFAICNCVVFLLIAEAAGADFRSKPEMKGRVTTWLDVSIPTPKEQGVAEVMLVLSVEGPPGLEVDRAEINDTVSGWSVALPVEKRREGETVLWTKTFALKQAKPGHIPLPVVTVRFRASPEAKWETVEWPDLLRQVRVDLKPAEVPEPPAIPSRWRRWTAGGLIVADVLLGAGVVLLLRRRRSRPAPLTPEQRAAAVITAAVKLLAIDVAAAHERMAEAVRGFLGERYHLPATHQTTSEFLDAVRRGVPPPEELREFLERCDLVKFAGVRPSAEECERTVEMAQCAAFV